MTDQTSEGADLRREIMRGTGCSSQEARDFFAHLGLYFSDRAKACPDGFQVFARGIYLSLFDLCARAAVETDDEI